MLLFLVIFGSCFHIPAYNPSERPNWGFFMHRHINRVAIFSLPPEMVVFYKRHLDELVRRSVDPDRRRHIVANEAPRHYIDLDRYPGSDSLMISWEEAVRRFTRDTLFARGMVPWHINRLRYALTNAFRLKNGREILRISADLGHYIADAHVPLHTTANYDGEQTGQVGIHALWESRLPEIFFEEYDLFVGRAAYLDNPFEQTWQAIRQAHLKVDSVFLLEQEVAKEIGADKIKGFDFRGARMQSVFNENFARRYHRRLAGMVEEQFRKSVKMTADIWFTSWVNAGQPDLSDCIPMIKPDALWRHKYDSLRQADSILFRWDIHVPGNQ